MKYAKNTIGYWLSKLPKGEREKALKNTRGGAAREKYSLETPCQSMTEAIDSAFWWDKSEEKSGYWGRIYDRESYVEVAMAVKGRQVPATPLRITHTIANPSTFRIDSTDPFTVSWEE